ncbi:MAG: hypothetical protein AAGC53_22375 [Actinomycetota bacterium]
MTPFVDACLAAPAGVALLAMLEARERTDLRLFEASFDSSPEAVAAAVRTVASMSFGELCSVAVSAAAWCVGPWVGDAPMNAARAYRNAEAQRPIAVAINERFGTKLHASMQPDAQEWWMSASPTGFTTLSPLFKDYDRVYDAGEFTWAGLWTVTDPPPETHDDLADAWEIYPGPVTRWRLPVRPTPRVFEIHRPDDWVELVTSYPKATERRHGSWSLPGPNQTLQGSGLLAVAGQHAAVDGMTTHLVPDWAAVAADYDAVHLSWAGLITTEGYVSRLGDGEVAMLRFWFSERTHWLHDHVGDPVPLPALELTGRACETTGLDLGSDPARRHADHALLMRLLGRRTSE